MNAPIAFLLGILIGWLVEWLIDWIYWRRKQGALAVKLSAAEANVMNLQAENADLTRQVASLEANAGRFEGVKGEFETKLASLEKEVSGLEAERDRLQAKIVDLESPAFGMGVAAVAGAVHLADVEGEAEAGAPAAEGAIAEASAVAVEGAAAEAGPPAAEGAALGVVSLNDAQFTGNVASTDYEEMAKFKYPLEYVEGIGPAYAEKLKAIGLVSCLDLLKAGASLHGREQIVEKTSISSKLILRWVNHVDLYRIKGVGSEYAELLEAAGVDTVVELAQRNQSNLFVKMSEVNAAKELVRKLPTGSQVADWIEQAKILPRLVSY